MSNPAGTLDVLAGVRLLDLKQTLDATLSGNVGTIPIPDRTFTSEVHRSNLDGIVGVKGRVALGTERKWFIPYYADVGAGDSQFTWEAMTGVGYAFGWGDVVGSYRYIDYHMKSSEKIDTASFSGPIIAAAFHW